MHSLGQTFAQSSQPMHLNQSMLCCPRYASGSSTFWYGYRWVTGFRPPGTSRFRTGIVTTACLRVIHRGRTTPPRVRTLRGPARSASDLGDFIRVLSLSHVHELPLPGAHEAALLRADPAGFLRPDLRAELEEAVDEGLGPDGAAGDEDVRRDERVGALHDAVRVVVGAATDRALSHRDDPLRLRHLLVQASDRGPELEGDGAIEEEYVDLTGARPVDDPEPLDVVPGGRGRRHLDRAAHDPEVEGPRRVPLRPVEELPDEAAFHLLKDLPARAALQGRVDVLRDPADKLLRLERVDVRLLRGLDHRYLTPAAFARRTRVRLTDRLALWIAPALPRRTAASRLSTGSKAGIILNPSLGGPRRRANGIWPKASPSPGGSTFRRGRGP